MGLYIAPRASELTAKTYSEKSGKIRHQKRLYDTPRMIFAVRHQYSRYTTYKQDQHKSHIIRMQELKLLFLKRLNLKKKEFIKAALTVQPRRLTLLINASR